MLRSRVDNRLKPKFGVVAVLDPISPPVVIAPVDELGKTDRHALNPLSSFISWCIERGLTRRDTSAPAAFATTPRGPTRPSPVLLR